VTFNNHESSTKGYLYTRKHKLDVMETDFIPPAEEIVADIRAASSNGHAGVTMHDGSVVRFRGLPADYDPTDRQKVQEYLRRYQGTGEIVTGLLYVDESAPDVHDLNESSETPLSQLPFEKLCPGAAALDQLQADFR